MPLTVIKSDPETYVAKVARLTRALLERGEQVTLPAPDAPTFAAKLGAVLEAVTPDHPIVLERDARGGGVVARRES